MLARGLRIGLLATIAFAAACAAALAPPEMRGWGATLAVFVVAFLAVPVMITVASFVLAAVYRSSVPPMLRAGPLGYLRCMLVEALWFAVLYWGLQAFPGLARGAQGGDRIGERTPVLLIHGFMCNAAVWVWLRRALRRRGHAVFTLDLEPVYGAIDAYAEPVAAHVARISASAGGRKVAVVGHSMGGLVGRALLRRFPGAPVSCLITLGTPHHGTALAPFGYGHNAREMRVTSAWLGGLRAFEEGAYPVPVTSVFSHHDNVVAPQVSAELAGATNVPLGGLGHMSMLFSGRVATIVAERLDAAQR